MFFLGSGTSGGEKGALWVEVGCPAATRRPMNRFAHLGSHRRESPDACVTYDRFGRLGHFVKMVHNGIEYGDMQLIAEVMDCCVMGLG